MVSTELLRRFPFFGPLNEAQLQQIAMISEELSSSEAVGLFNECQPAEFLYLLMDGSVDLTYTSEEEFHPKGKKVFPVGEINPGEIFGISALVSPYEYSATGNLQAGSHVLQINAIEFRNFLDADPQLGYLVMHQIAKAAVERLAYTRVQLAAAWA